MLVLKCSNVSLSRNILKTLLRKFQNGVWHFFFMYSATISIQITLVGTVAFVLPAPNTNFPAGLIEEEAFEVPTAVGRRDLGFEGCDVEPTETFSSAVVFFKGFPSKRLPTPVNALNFGASGSSGTF